VRLRLLKCTSLELLLMGDPIRDFEKELGDFDVVD
jgi:hypothetical protein